MSQQQVKDIFTAVDEDRSGAIDAKELQRALSKGGFIMSLATVAQLIRMFDRNNDARVDLEEFEGLHNFLTEAQTTFAALAGSTTAQLTTDQLRTALNQLGYTWIDPQAFAVLTVAFDPQHDARLGLTEFIAMLSFLKSVVATFRGFDSARAGVISLNLNQFLYAASFTR